MAQENFQRDISVTGTSDEVWNVIIDVPKLVSWVTILHDVATIAPLESYTAVLTDRIGMFKLSADLDITVKDKKEAEFITVHAEGEDRQVGSRIAVDARVTLVPTDAGGTTFEVTGTYEVSGRVATLGGSAIRKKANKILNEFFSSMEREFA